MVRGYVEALLAIPCDKNADLGWKRENGHATNYRTHAGQVPVGFREWNGALYS